jgi:hypothetical protein
VTSPVPLTYPSRAALSSPPYSRAANPLQIRQARRTVRTCLHLIVREAEEGPNLTAQSQTPCTRPGFAYADVGGRGRVWAGPCTRGVPMTTEETHA